MPSLVINGAQWGDEGKGKLVDYLTCKADWVVRFQGGNNAGHTLVVDGVKTKLQLVPSGILRRNARCLIGAGVVANPEVLMQEIDNLRKAGVTVEPHKLLIDENAHLVLEYHMAIDAAREEALGQKKIGTTGRGIGPAYEDRAGRCGVRFAHLLDLAGSREDIERVVAEKNRYLKAVLGSPRQVSFEEVWRILNQASEVLGPHIGNGSRVLNDALRAGRRVIFEGAQATMLDQTFGTIPYVTAASTVAGAASTGAGVGPCRIDYVLGVAKAYCTRVGAGPFPTELHDELGEKIRQRGVEFGTVTGRPRRCGWFDAVAVKRAMRLNGYDSLAITKLDVLSGLEKVKICTGYELNGREIDDVPALAGTYEKVEPHFVELDGWRDSIESASEMNALPRAARVFLDELARSVGCPISLVSVGPERAATIAAAEDRFLTEFVK